MSLTMTTEEIRRLIEDEDAAEELSKADAAKSLLGVMGQMVTALEDSQRKLAEIAARPPPAPPPTPAAPAPAPAAPPPAHKPERAPTVWNCTVTARDKENRIQGIRFEAWEGPK